VAVANFCHREGRSAGSGWDGKFSGIGQAIAAESARDMEPDFSGAMVPASHPVTAPVWARRVFRQFRVHGRIVLTLVNSAELDSSPFSWFVCNAAV